MSAVSAHSDGVHVVSGSYDGDTKVWDVRATIPLYTLAPVAPEERVLCVGWSSHESATLYTAGTDRTLRSYGAALTP